MSLFDESNNEKSRKLDNTIDELRKKYGKGVVMKSTFLNGYIKYMEGGTTEVYSPKISSILRELVILIRINLRYFIEYYYSDLRITIVIFCFFMYNYIELLRIFGFIVKLKKKIEFIVYGQYMSI